MDGVGGEGVSAKVEATCGTHAQEKAVRELRDVVAVLQHTMESRFARLEDTVSKVSARVDRIVPVVRALQKTATLSHEKGDASSVVAGAEHTADAGADAETPSGASGLLENDVPCNSAAEKKVEQVPALSGSGSSANAGGMASTLLNSTLSTRRKSATATTGGVQIVVSRGGGQNTGSRATTLRHVRVRSNTTTTTTALHAQQRGSCRTTSQAHVTSTVPADTKPSLVQQQRSGTTVTASQMSQNPRRTAPVATGHVVAQQSPLHQRRADTARCVPTAQNVGISATSPRRGQPGGDSITLRRQPRSSPRLCASPGQQQGAKQPPVSSESALLKAATGLEKGATHGSATATSGHQVAVLAKKVPTPTRERGSEVSQGLLARRPPIAARREGTKSVHQVGSGAPNSRDNVLTVRLAASTSSSHGYKTSIICHGACIRFFCVEHNGGTLTTIGELENDKTCTKVKVKVLQPTPDSIRILKRVTLKRLPGN